MSHTRPATTEERATDVANRAAALESAFSRGLISRRQYDEGHADLADFEGYRRPTLLPGLLAAYPQRETLVRATHRKVLRGTAAAKMKRAASPRLRPSKTLTGQTR